MIEPRFSRRLSAAVRALAVIAVLGSATSTAQASGICDASALSAALSSASAGSTVRIGDCTITGSFVVPPGVTLEGEGSFSSRIHVPSSGSGVVLEAGTTTTTLSKLRVTSDALFGVYVDAGGNAAIENAMVVMSRGIGIAAEDVGALEIERVGIAGAVTPSSAPGISPDSSPSIVSTHGLIISRVGSAIVEDVTISGFASAGAIAASSASRWDSVSVSNNIGVGLAIAAGSAHLDRVRAQRTLRGAMPMSEVPAGIAIVAGARVETDRLHSSRNEGFGVFQDAAGAVAHDALYAGTNRHAGLWAQGGSSLSVDGSRLVDNDYAGLLAFELGHVEMDGTVIENTHLLALPGFPESGDGVQLVRTSATFDNVTLTDNDRAGVLAQLSSTQTLSDLTFDNVSVSGTGPALGVLVQKGGSVLVPSTGITRLGSTAGNDLQIEDPLGLFAGGWEPCYLPVLQSLAQNGIGALFQANDPPTPVDG